MLRYRSLLIICLNILLALSLSQASYIETFAEDDSDWQAWEVKNNGQLNEFTPTWFDDGSDDGYIGTFVDNDSWRLYGIQPETPELYGDLADKTFQVDMRIEGEVSSKGDNPLVRFYVGSTTGGNDYYVSNDAFSWDVNYDIDWTTHTVDLIAENFIEWPNQASHSKSFYEVLAQADDIGLVFTDSSQYLTDNRYLGFKSTNGASVYVDNFSIGGFEEPISQEIPEPATMVLMALGGLCCFIRKRIIPVLQAVR